MARASRRSRSSRPPSRRPPMLERLGYVLYWLGSILALAIIAFAAWLILFLHASETWNVVVFFGGIAGAIWLIGRACRYVLSGNCVSSCRPFHPVSCAGLDPC